MPERFLKWSTGTTVSLSTSKRTIMAMWGMCLGQTCLKEVPIWTLTGYRLRIDTIADSGPDRA